MPIILKISVRYRAPVARELRVCIKKVQLHLLLTARKIWRKSSANRLLAPVQETRWIPLSLTQKRVVIRAQSAKSMVSDYLEVSNNKLSLRLPWAIHLLLVQVPFREGSAKILRSLLAMGTVRNLVLPRYRRKRSLFSNKRN